jgi:copper chaperone
MIEFQIPDMSCGHCAGRVTQALQRADPACTVRIDLAARRVQVQTAEDRQALAHALAEAGYPRA